MNNIDLTVPFETLFRWSTGICLYPIGDLNKDLTPISGEYYGRYDNFYFSLIYKENEKKVTIKCGVVQTPIEEYFKIYSNVDEGFYTKLCKVIKDAVDEYKHLEEVFNFRYLDYEVNNKMHLIIKSKLGADLDTLDYDFKYEYYRK